MRPILTDHGIITTNAADKIQRVVFNDEGVVYVQTFLMQKSERIDRDLWQTIGSVFAQANGTAGDPVLAKLTEDETRRHTQALSQNPEERC